MRLWYQGDSLPNHILYNVLSLGLNVVRLILKYFYLLSNPIRQPVVAEPVDILVLGTCQKDIDRTKSIWRILQSKGFKIKSLHHDTIRLYPTLFQYQIKTRWREIPSSIFFLELFSRYLMSAFKPKMICLFDSHDVLPSLIRRQAHNYGSKTVYIPDGVTTAVFNNTCFDFDYYFVFGESSINNIYRNPLRIGNTRIVKTGSPYIDLDRSLPIPREDKAILYFASAEIGMNSRAQKDFGIVFEFALKNPDFKVYIKPHPSDKSDYLLKKPDGIANIIVLEKTTNIWDALAKATLVVTTASNASIEAALVGRPTVVVNTTSPNESKDPWFGSGDYLQIEQYFLPRVQNADALKANVLHIINEFDFFQKKCSEFVSYHYARTFDSVDYAANILEQIIRGEENFPYLELEEKISAF